MKFFRTVLSVVLILGASPFQNAGADPAGLPAPTTLRIADAITLAIQNNLTSRLAKAGTEEARGEALKEASDLLPKLTGTIQQSRVFKENLEAQGFPPNNLFPILIGPFNSFDARLQLVQNIFDANAFWKNAAGRAGERIAAQEERMAREQVAAAAALAYLEAQRTERAVSVAVANQTLSGSLFKLARDQHSAGVSTGVDVARAETDFAQENLRVIRAQVDARNAEVMLKRTIGMPMDKAIVLEDLPQLTDSELMSLDQAISQALQGRAEIQIAKEMNEQSHDSLSAARADHLPTLTALADYGYSGTDPSNTARTGSIGGRLTLPILAGGETHGKVVKAEAEAQQAEDRYADVRAQVEEDVRLAVQTLLASVEETKTADQAVALAQKELKMSRDRFSAGAGDNIQVLSAQTALAVAANDQVNAVAHYDTARVNMAAALGRIEAFILRQKEMYHASK